MSLAFSLWQLATLLPSYQARFAMLVSEMTAALAEIGIGPEQVRAALSGLDSGAVGGVVTSVLLGLANGVSNLVFLLSLLLFMGLDVPGFPDRVHAIGADRPPSSPPWSPSPTAPAATRW